MKDSRKKFDLYLAVTVALGFYVMLYHRSVAVETVVAQVQECGGCYQSWVLMSDGWLALLFMLLMVVAYWAPWYLLRTLARLLVVALILLYLLDLTLFKNLIVRLFFYDISTFFDLNAIKSWLSHANGIWAFPLVISVLGLFFVFVFKHQKSAMHYGLLALLFSPMLVWAYVNLNHKPIKFVHDMYIRNFISINLQMGEAVAYSPEFVEAAAQRIDSYEALQCKPGLKQQPNIILVVLESFSFYQSQLLSGIYDWTPNVDKLARQYKYFDQFYANNFNSLGGRLAMLTGEKTFRQVAPFMTTMRQGYYNTQRNLPAILRENNYHSSFLDAADLGFTNTGDYMRSLGFDFVEGHEASFYIGHPRFAYEAVADEVLYDRVLEYTKQAEQPYFSMVITVSSHHPYIDPRTQQPDLEAVIKYADQAVYRFYQDLLAQDFFSNGVLILTSDHRSMTPLFEQELAALGEPALAKVPLVLIGKDYAGLGVDSALTQQSDLLNSIQYLIAPEHCYRQGEGNVLAQPAQSADCVFHNRGDYRDQVDVYCQAGASYGQVKLKGDDTELHKGSIPNAEQVIDFINVSRVANMLRDAAYQGQGD